MKWIVSAEKLPGKTWRSVVVCPGGQEDHPFSTELTNGPTAASEKSALLKGVKIVLNLTDATEIQVKIRKKEDE